MCFFSSASHFLSVALIPLYMALWQSLRSTIQQNSQENDEIQSFDWLEFVECDERM